jgi:hypothetical protein
MSVVPQSCSECSSDAGSCYLRDAQSAVLRSRGHHMEPLHASKNAKELAQNPVGIRREDLPRNSHM